MVANVLQRPTLVLNRDWQPVNVATVARALVLLWNESARVVDPADMLPAYVPGAIHECAPGRAGSLQNCCTGFDSSHSC